jgi:hypothetical protein
MVGTFCDSTSRQNRMSINLDAATEKIFETFFVDEG